MTNPRGILRLLLKDIPVRLTSFELCTAGLLLRAEDGRLWRALHSLPTNQLNSEAMDWEPVSAPLVIESHVGAGAPSSLTLPPLSLSFQVASVQYDFRTVAMLTSRAMEVSTFVETGLPLSQQPTTFMLCAMETNLHLVLRNLFQQLKHHKCPSWLVANWATRT